MIKKITTTLIILMVMLMIVPEALATDESTNLNLETNDLKVGPCVATMIKGTIENTGENKDTYILDSNSNWITIAPNKVTLDSGESEIIRFFITPSCYAEPGEYTIDITAESDNSKDTETITVDVLRIHSVTIDTITTKTECIGDKLTFDIDISNIGKTEETFKITTTTGITEKDEVTIGSGETKTVTLDIIVTAEKKTIEFNVKSTTSYAQDSKTLQIIGANCYSEEVSITPISKTMCIKESSDFTLSIKNTGTKEDTYSITTDFGELSANELTIDAGTEKKVKLRVTPEDMGEHKANIEVRSAHFKETLSVNVHAQNCKGIAVITIPKENSACKGEIAEYMITVKNIGKTEDTIELSSTMGELSENTITIEAGNTKDLLLSIQTKNLDYETYPITVTAESEIKDTSKSILTVENCYSATLNAEPNTETVCPGRYALFTLTIENTGKNNDTYTIEASEGTLTENTIEIDTLETKNVELRVRTDSEDKSVTINIFSENTHATKTVNLSTKDEETCFGFTVNTNPQEIEAQEYKGYLYTITVKNTGEFASNFTISSVGGPEWIFIEPKSSEIEPDSENEYYAYISPPYGTESGTYNVDLEIKRNDETTKTVNLKLILGNIEKPSEVSGETEDPIKEEPVIVEKTFTASIDTETSYEITKDQSETIEGIYTVDDKDVPVTINIRTGSFIIEIDNTSIEDENPELGTNIYELTTDEKKYTVSIEFTEVNTTTDTYKFKIEDVKVTVLTKESPTSPTGNATKEQSPLTKKIIYATIIGLIIIILILFGPEIAEKTKNFFTEEIEEEDEKDKDDEMTTTARVTGDEISLDEIKGIGGKRKEALIKAGILNANQLAEANVSDLMTEAVTSEKQAKNLIKKAKAIVKKKSNKQEAKEKPKEISKTKKQKKAKSRKDVKEDIKDILESI